jgi:hypothetical protein
LEKRAALLSSKYEDYEPTRSVLLRSAASLAIDCGEFREAERLIAAALSGSPPEEIADELRDLLEQVYFNRHLELRGVSLSPEELQLSIAGRGVGFGIAPSEEYVERVQAFEKLVYRTAERKMGIEYREGGSPIKDVKANFEVFMTVPRAASFAVTMKIGKAKEQMEMNFKQDINSSEVIDEIVYCLETLNSGHTEAVERHIASNAYYTNFVALSRKLAPDGEDVRLVGLTVYRGGKKKEVALTKVGRNIGAVPRKSTRKVTFSLPIFHEVAIQEEEQRVEVKGRLKFADSRSGDMGTIILVDIDDFEHTVIVPEGWLSDIVRPLWESEVIVRGTRTEAGILLEDIKRAARRRPSIRP